MRARKPWSRLRLMLLGWYVRLVAMVAARLELGGNELETIATRALKVKVIPLGRRLRRGLDWPTPYLSTARPVRRAKVAEV